MNAMMLPVGIATLTGPFCVTTWLFLLPRIKFDEVDNPDHSNWDIENKKHLFKEHLKQEIEEFAEEELKSEKIE